MSLFEELQKLDSKIEQTLRALSLSRPGDIERRALLLELKELNEKRDDLRTIGTYFDP